MCNWDIFHGYPWISEMKSLFCMIDLFLFFQNRIQCDMYDAQCKLFLMYKERWSDDFVQT